MQDSVKVPKNQFLNLLSLNILQQKILRKSKFNFRMFIKI